MFWNSMSDWEKDHIAAAFAFELNMVETEAVRERAMNELLVNISQDLAERVSAKTGLRVAPAGDPQNPTPSAPTPAGPINPGAGELRSPALSMNKRAESAKGRKIAILIDDGVDAGMLKEIAAALADAEALFDLIAPHAGHVAADNGEPFKVNKAAPNAPWSSMTRRSCRAEAMRNASRSRDLPINSSARPFGTASRSPSSRRGKAFARASICRPAPTACSKARSIWRRSSRC